MSHWLKDCWYQAGWSSEVEAETLLERTLLDVPIVFHRGKDGTVIALHDMCPHRFAPLSAGRKEGDTIVCGYHGLGFGADGGCVRNPHGHISEGMRVESYPTAERHGAIWIWLGEASKADEALLPDLSFIDNAPPKGRIKGYIPTEADYQLITDNILDLSHADYLHPHTLGGMMTESEFTCEEDGDEVVLTWVAKDAPPPGVFVAEIPPPARGDFRIDVRWQPPSLMVLRVVGKKHGEPFERDDYNFTLHNMVPESKNRTHYFYCATRTKGTEDAEFMAMLKGGLEHSFLNEDKPMLEKQQERIADRDFWAMRPRMLPVDKGAVLVRRKLDAMIAEQSS